MQPEGPKVKPFDIEAAKRGAELVTRAGKEASDFRHFPSATSSYTCAAVVEGHVQSYTDQGRFLKDSAEHERDLFMKSVKRTVYVQIFNKKGDTDVPGLKAFAFDSERDALQNVNETEWPVLGTFPIEIEE